MFEIKQLQKEKIPSALKGLKGLKSEEKQKWHNVEPWEGKIDYQGLQIFAVLRGRE